MIMRNCIDYHDGQLQLQVIMMTYKFKSNDGEFDADDKS